MPETNSQHAIQSVTLIEYNQSNQTENLSVITIRFKFPYCMYT